jgi:hypothetical protein
MDTEKKTDYKAAMDEVIDISNRISAKSQQLWNTVADPLVVLSPEEKEKIYDAKFEMIEDLSRANAILGRHKKKSIDPLYTTAAGAYKQAVHLLQQLNLKTSC